MSSDFTLSTPLGEIRGVGLKAARDLSLMGVTNVGKLLAHLPLRHEVIAGEAPIRELKPSPEGARDGTVASARGMITATRYVRSARRPRFEAVLCDDTGRLDLVWFNAPYVQETIKVGTRLRVQGKVRPFGPGIQIANPTWQLVDGGGERAPGGAPGEGGPGRSATDRPVPASPEGLRPIYPASGSITSARIERAVRVVLAHALTLVRDHLPDEFRAARALPSLAEAYRMQHQARDEDEVARSRRRLAYDELLMLQLGVHMKRAHLRTRLRAPALAWSPAIDERIRARLAYALTPGQEEAVRDIAKDLACSTPTNRLVQGDVGSGKTLVALYAMLLAVAHRRQAALLAPTEILAAQHARSIGQALAGSRTRVVLLAGSLDEGARREALGAIASGEAHIVVGTHALLGPGVRFKSLGVVAIDEQHRFGVAQRATLRARGTGSDDAATPHLLVLTATPIPRTLALTLFGDVDITTIKGLPPGRSPVRTLLCLPGSSPTRDEVYARVGERLAKGEQAFIVAPAIDPSRREAGDAEDDPSHAAPIDQRARPMANVRDLVLELGAGPLRGHRVAALHGRLAARTRDDLVDRFRAGEIDALVTTSIIEVGVDIPNASMMVVEDADRFGLAQLHQLRGRVGRGSRASACVLIADPQTPEARERLVALASTPDGFALAERDFELRGPGEVFGTRQSGLPPLRVADLMRDRDLLGMARRDAASWIERSPLLDHEDETLLHRRLFKTYGATLGLGDVG